MITSSFKLIFPTAFTAIALQLVPTAAHAEAEEVKESASTEVEPNETAQPGDAESDSNKGRSSDASQKAQSRPEHKHHGAVYVDPLGFLLFGPSLGAEVALGPVGFGATFRWFNPGLLGKALFLDEGSKFTFSYGLGLNAQYYFLSSLAGPHLGLAAEYLHVALENEGSRYKTVSSYIVPQLQGGYRYGWKRWFIGGVAGVGYAARVSSRIEDLDTGEAPTGAYVQNESSFYGTARLDLGVYF